VSKKPQPKGGAVAYIRVSTTRQAEEGVSLPAQLDRVRAWCASTGRELHSHWTDAGLSGGKAANRPALQEALAQVCAIKGVLVVYSLSRLARSTRDMLDIAERLEKAGADLVSLSESIDTTTAAGRMVFRMLAVLGEFERDLISERTAGAMAHLRARGAFCGGGVPYGYRISDLRDVAGNEAGIVPYAPEQGVIGQIVHLHACGRGSDTIALMLNAHGVPCRGSKWHAKTVRRILARNKEVA
jgi:DNA invertase Pin-like site-specific DNA recombinase